MPPVYVFAELLKANVTEPPLGAVPPTKTLIRPQHPGPNQSSTAGPEGLAFPTWIQNATQTSYQFYLGPPGSGAPVHFHDNAINLLVYGRKRCSLCALPGPTGGRWRRVAS